MSDEKGKDPRGDSEGQDTDEIFEDHPELAPDESRISVGWVKDLDAESKRRAQAGDPVEKAGDKPPRAELSFPRNQDFAGDGISMPIEAIHDDAVGEAQDWTALPAEEGGTDQGRGLPHPAQAAAPESPSKRGPEHKIWASILRRVGGGSPGSEENLQLADLFSRVQFPSDQEGVLRRLPPDAEFRLKEGIVVDLKHAVETSRIKTFRSLGDLVDCVKDELRRQEADGRKLLRMA